MKDAIFRPILVGSALTASLGGLLFGYDTAVIAGAVGALDAFFIKPQSDLGQGMSSALLGFVVSSALLGCVLGSVFGGLVSARLGRRGGLKLAACCFLVSALGSAAPEFLFAPIGKGGAEHLYHFVFYRVLGGFGVGLASMIAPMYIAEVSPARYRGMLVTGYQMAIVIGIVLVYFVNYAIAVAGDGDQWLNSVGWRYMFLSEAFPAAAFFALLFFVPESPRHFFVKGEEAKGEKILLKLLTREELEEERSKIREFVITENRPRNLFSFGYRLILLGVFLASLQQWVGVNAVLYYAPEIFKNLGVDKNTSLFQTILVGAVNMVFTIVALLTVDRLGRRPLLIAGGAIMSASMLLLGCSFYFDASSLLALLSMLGFMAGFSLSWGPVVWVLLSEIFPNEVRGQLMAVAVTAMWISNYVVSSTFPIMDQNQTLTDLFNHGFSYWVYGLVCVVAAVFVYLFVPETKGKTLEEMETLWKISQ